MQTFRNRILLENYYLPGDFERQIGAFIEHSGSDEVEFEEKSFIDDAERFRVFA